MLLRDIGYVFYLDQFDPINRMIPLSVIPLSCTHCTVLEYSEISFLLIKLWMPLSVITFGQRESDNINRKITLLVISLTLSLHYICSALNVQTKEALHRDPAQVVLESVVPVS